MNKIAKQFQMTSQDPGTLNIKILCEDEVVTDATVHGMVAAVALYRSVLDVLYQDEHRAEKVSTEVLYRKNNVWQPWVFRTIHGKELTLDDLAFTVVDPNTLSYKEDKPKVIQGFKVVIPGFPHPAFYAAFTPSAAKAACYRNLIELGFDVKYLDLTVFRCPEHDEMVKPLHEGQAYDNLVAIELLMNYK